MTTANQPYGAPMVAARPLGVTILAILNALSGIFTILLGVLAFGAGAATGTGIFAAIGAVIGGVVIIIGLFQLFVAWGLWNGKQWAWFLALIFGILGIISGIVSLPGGIVSLLINAVIVYYLFTAPVKAFFGR